MSRKPARRRSEIPARVLRALSLGETASLNLVEWLAVDMAVLADHVAPEVGDVAREVAGRGVMERMRTIGAALTLRRARALASHASDTARGWACFHLAGSGAVRNRLEAARPFANDAHMGVREFAWSAARPAFPAALKTTLRLLRPWTRGDLDTERRFAIEGTRPRGVWCKHLRALREDPEPGLVLLEACRSDPSRYVQNAVANWLNDASKDHPAWVRQVCERWSAESPTRETATIVRRALRTLRR